MTDEAGGTTRCSACRRRHRAEHLRDIGDMPKYDRLEIEHFFTVYKDLEPGKSVEGANWTRVEEAEAEVRASFQRAIDENYYTPAATIVAPH